MKIFAAAFLALIVLSRATVAQTGLNVVSFGHRVGILESKDLQRELRVDGRSLLTDGYISLDEFAIVDGIPTIIGTSSPGGNACSGSPFVLSFPSGKAPRLDGPTGSCRPATRKVERERVTFATSASPTVDGETWIWTPTEGIRSTGKQKFASDTSKGWDGLRDRSIEQPGALLEHAPVADQIYSLMGSDRGEVLSLFEGPASGRFEGNWYFGESCRAHDCYDHQIIVAVNFQERRTFLAWRHRPADIVVRPVVKEWPPEARSFLLQWSRRP